MHSSPDDGAGARHATERERSPRERLSLNAGWRFRRGDPPGVDPAALLYDIRPEAGGKRDDGPADARPQEAARSEAAAYAVLKPWILPTGSRFLKDAARRYVRPEGNPGGDLPCVQPGFDDGGWRSVDLPHDWGVEGEFDAAEGGVGGGMGRLPSPGIGWYRKKIEVSPDDAGKRIFLDVDGAMSYAAVWLNGVLAGGWPYGYASWRIDLTPHVVPGGVNQLAIRLDNPPESSRWYPGGGLYRNVWLVKTDPVHVAQWGVSLTTPSVSQASAAVALRIVLDNDSETGADVAVQTRVYVLDAEGRTVGDAVASADRAAVRIAAWTSATVSQETAVPDPRLWGPPPEQEPNRYVAVTDLRREGRLIDRCETRFGIRSLRFEPAGLFVNGQRIPIRGVNMHHDLGALGAAFHERAAERQLLMLREMGCNAVRMSHNPPAPELLELTDRLGFLVVDEIFDCWHMKKCPLDFHLIFPDWNEQDLRAMIRRDRNHPSVILWSVGNEVGEQYTGEEGAAMAGRLCGIAREEDPTRPATAAMNWAKPDMPFPAALDVVSLNYQGEGIRDTPAFEGVNGVRTPPQYPAFRDRFPDRLIVSSETASALSTRGTYLFPVSGETSGPVREGSGGDAENRFVSAYELHAADFGSSADKVFASLDRHPYVAGEFVWTGWDYLGEPTPYYSARSSYSGIIDLAGFPKDRFYLYQSRWRPEFPMAHILPHWTWPERIGQVTPVHVFTSGDAAELFLNGVSLGRRAKGPYEYRLRWDDAVYQPGELKAVAYKDGKPWATAVTVTAGAPARLEAAADRPAIRADGRDLAFVAARVADSNGVTVPRANPRIRFGIEGPGEIVATDNGDPTNLEPFRSAERSAFNGWCLAIVRTRPGQTGQIRISASADGLLGASVTIQSDAAS